MVVAEQEEPKNIRFRMDPVRKDRWLALCEAKKISQQDAIEAIIDLVLAQDDTVQSMMLGQTKAREDLVELVLRRMAKDQDDLDDLITEAPANGDGPSASAPPHSPAPARGRGAKSSRKR